MDLIDAVEIKFIYGFHKFTLIISCLDTETEDYSIYLYKDYTDFKNYNKYQDTIEPFDEVFSTWIDSDGGEVEGNQRIVKKGYDDAIDYSYALFESIMRT